MYLICAILLVIAVSSDRSAVAFLARKDPNFWGCVAIRTMPPPHPKLTPELYIAWNWEKLYTASVYFLAKPLHIFTLRVFGTFKRRQHRNLFLSLFCTSVVWGEKIVTYLEEEEPCFFWLGTRKFPWALSQLFKWKKVDIDCHPLETPHGNRLWSQGKWALFPFTSPNSRQCALRCVPLCHKRYTFIRSPFSSKIETIHSYVKFLLW